MEAAKFALWGNKFLNFTKELGTKIADGAVYAAKKTKKKELFLQEIKQKKEHILLLRKQNLLLKKLKKLLLKKEIMLMMKIRLLWVMKSLIMIKWVRIQNKVISLIVYKNKRLFFILNIKKN